MAKGSSPKSGNSKIRFIMLEADLSDGDLSQVTQAIQNALRPAQQTVKLIQTSNGNGEDDVAIDLDQFETLDIESDRAEPPKQRAQRSSKPRVAKTPTVLNDIDVTSDPSLKDFVADFEISTSVDKYLVIALWFRDARQIQSVTVDHVYTCFKLLGWGTGANDFAKTLRNLRDEQSLKGGSKEGFTLTLPGAAKIEAKKRSA